VRSACGASRGRRTLAALGCGFVVAACGGGSSAATSSQDLVVGLITPTSGLGGQLAGIVTRGANAAIRDVDSRRLLGARQLRLEVCDNGSSNGTSDPQKTVACAARMLRDHVPAVAVTDEGALAVVKNQLMANRVITVGAYGSPDFDNPQQLPYLFSLVTSNDQFIGITVDYIRSRGYHRVADLSDTSAPSAAISKALDDGLRAAGVAVQNETFGLADVDVSAQTSRVIAAAPDLAFINTYGLVAAHVMSDLVDAHAPFRVLGSGAFSTTPVPLILGGGEIPNLRLTTFTSATTRPGQPYPPALQHLVDALHADGQGPLATGGTIFLAMYGYDTVSLIAHGYAAATSSDPDAVRAAIEGIHLTRAGGDVYVQDITYAAGHHAPVCDPGSTDFSYGRVPDANGVLTQADPPLPSCS
jgi:ABC-type branched-subunit amino acid transport system substrate-binding protein